MNYALILFCLSSGAAASFVWILCLKYTGLSRKLGDVPNARSSHQKVIPRGAGFSFAIAVLAMSSFFGMSILSCFVAALVATLGLADDIYSISAKKRFSIQAILCLLVLLPSSLGIGVPLPIIAFLWILMLTSINFYNFADGINGHLAIQALVNVASWGFLALRYNLWSNFFVDPMVLGLLGSLMVFLWFNVYRKSVFMGDAGSTFLGFYLIAMPLDHFMGRDSGSLPWILHLGAYLAFSFIIFADCTLLLGTKLFARIPLSMPHRQHFYQQLSRRPGWTQLRVSTVLGLWQLCIGMTYIAAITSHPFWGVVAASLMLMYVYCICLNGVATRRELTTLSSIGL